LRKSGNSPRVLITRRNDLPFQLPHRLAIQNHQTPAKVAARNLLTAYLVL
jgi:hypothetical protein